jgi:predicted RNA binding protein with dsRBD fold (UPF0201 family)
MKKRFLPEGIKKYRHGVGCRTSEVGERIAMPKWGRVHRDFLEILITRFIPWTFNSISVIIWKQINLLTENMRCDIDGKIIYHYLNAGRMDIAIEAPIHPTEDPERVFQAVKNLFPDVVRGESYKSQDIQTLARRISELMIKDTARVLLLRSIRGNEILFHLNRQAAFAGKVNFTDGKSVLGDITVRITDDEPEKIARIIAGGSGL